MLRAIVQPDGRQQILETVPPYHMQILDLRGQSPEEHAAGLEGGAPPDVAPDPAERPLPLFEVRATRLDDEQSASTSATTSSSATPGAGRSSPATWPRFYDDPEAAPPPLELSFRDYIVAAQELERSAVFERALEYWRGRLADLPPAPELPLAKSPAALGRPNFVRHAARLPRVLWSRLKERASRAGLTPSGLLVAAFSEVLGAWSKSPRFTINLTLFNRLPLHPQVNDIIGDFTSLTLLTVDTGLPGDLRGARPAGSDPALGGSRPSLRQRRAGAARAGAVPGRPGAGLHARRLHQHPGPQPVAPRGRRRGRRRGARAAWATRGTSSARRPKCGSTTRSWSSRGG